MKRVAFTACDEGFVQYAIRMIVSLKVFHPEVPVRVIDLGLSNRSIDFLRSVGAEVVKSGRTGVLAKRRLGKNFSDFLIRAHLGKARPDEVLWIDADTLIVDRLDEVFSGKEAVVGHPGRGPDGPLYTCGQRWAMGTGTAPAEWIRREVPECKENSAYFATGMWLCRSPKLLQRLDEMLDELSRQRTDSPFFTAAVHQLGLSYRQLDPKRWNFSRHLVGQGLYERRGIEGVILWSGTRVGTVGFSRSEQGRVDCRAAYEMYCDYLLLKFLSMDRNQDSRMKPDKMNSLHRFIRDEIEPKHLEGEIVECGVWRGGSGLCIWNGFLGKKKIWLYDSYEGMPPPTPNDFAGKRGMEGTRRRVRGDGGSFGEGDLSDTSVGHVRRVFAREGVQEEDVRIVKGFIKDPGHFSAAPSQIACLHIDLDFYEPYKVTLEALYDRVVPGGAIVFDDYGYFVGAKRAVDELCKRTGEKLRSIDKTSRRVIVKGAR